MNYPLISEYIEAIKSAEDNFKELTNLRPVLDDDGQPIFEIVHPPVGRFFVPGLKPRAWLFKPSTSPLQALSIPCSGLQRPLFMPSTLV